MKRVWYTILWLVSLPIQVAAFTITRIRVWRYNPEKILMPCCGYRGERGSGGKSCWVTFKTTVGPEKGAIQHICLRCGCDKYYTSLAYPAERWFPKESTVPSVEEMRKRSVI